MDARGVAGHFAQTACYILRYFRQHERSGIVIEVKQGRERRRKRPDRTVSGRIYTTILTAMLCRPKYPVVTLTTDFGLQDHYVASMKGVILSVNPAMPIVDITHEIPPFSIISGAYAISQAAPCFP